MRVSTLFVVFLLFKQENLYNREPEQPFSDLFGLGFFVHVYGFGVTVYLANIFESILE